MQRYHISLIVAFLLLCPLALRAGDKKAVAVGNRHALVLKTDGSLWSFGLNLYGQVGDGTTSSRHEPVKIMDDVVQISAQENNSMAVKADGSLWAWGENNYGSLGDGTTDEHHSPVKIMDNVSKVCTGSQQSYAICRDGSLWGWGNNSHGQLGDGTNTDRKTPVRIMGNVKDVSGGDGEALVVCNDGTLYLLTPGKPFGPRKIMEGVKKAACWGVNMVLRNDGTLWTWGFNNDGQLGNGSTQSFYSPQQAGMIMSGVSDISSGDRHAMAIKTDGTLWGWGWNQYGQIGNGTTTNSYSPVKVYDNVSSVACGYTISAWITRDGELCLVGRPF